MATNPLNNMGAEQRSAQPFSVMESEWRAASVETCRIINVNIEDWSVDCVSEYGNKRYFDIQVMSPYFHFAYGEGVYVQPEVGALVWLCVPSGGRFAAPFVLGFQSAHDEEHDGFRGGRQTLNPGDIMLRTRDENFLVLRRGGVVQIGATPTAQRFYIPIRNFIRDFCENYELFTFGGDLTWVTERDDQTTDGAARTKFSLRAKEKADSKEHIATLTIGSHGEDSPTTLLLEIRESGDADAAVMVSLTATKEGNLNWVTQKGYSIEAKESIQLTAKEKDIVITAEQGAYSLSVQKNMTMSSKTGEALLDGKTKAVVKSATQAVMDAPQVCLGNGAASPVVKGDMLVNLLTALINQISTFTCAAPGAPVVAAPAVASLIGQLSGLLSTSSFTK